jgi:GT2 family glycosyltransferase
MAGPTRPTAGEKVTSIAPAPPSPLDLSESNQGGEQRLGLCVVICAYTEARWALLVRAVQSAFAQTMAPSQVVVVIDHCPALLRRARQELTGLIGPGDERLTIIANTGQSGLADARNTGIGAARAELVAFLDDDAEADADWLMQLGEAYRDPAVVATGGRVVADWEAGRPGWFPPEFDWVVGCTYRGLPEALAPVRNVIGANMSFRRDALLDVGGFHTGLGRVGTRPLGCEETELCIRLASHQQGQRILYEPAAIVHHHVPASRATWAYFRSRCYAEGLSKAKVRSLAGAESALSSERSYLLTTIPRGIGLAWQRGLPARQSAARAIAIVLGVVATGLGYVVGRIRKPDDDTAPNETALSRAVGVVGVAALPLALVLWWLALQHVPLSRMTDIGLVSVLPLTFWAALGALAVGFAITVTRRRSSSARLGAYIVALIVVLHATPELLYGTLQYAWAWKHVSLINDIFQHGRITGHPTGQLAAYQAWPGFFTANSLLLKLTGWTSALSYASWGPLFFNVLYLGPLIMIFRRFTADGRLIWTAVWFFYLGNWVGQDYLSPQAFSYFLYLVVIAICLRWYSPDGIPLRGSGTTTTVPTLQHEPRNRAAILLCIAVLVAAIACSHQLTPFMLISAAVVLVVFRRSSERLLPLVVAALTVGWIVYSSRGFLDSNLHSILASIGHPGANTNSSFISLSDASRGQVLVAKVDRVLSASLWLLAAVGLWRRRRNTRADLPLLLLALSPIPLVLMSNYGGEMVFRVYLFSLPFVAFFAAAAFFPSAKASSSWRWTAGLVALSVVLLAAFSFSYYGDEQVNYFTPQEVQAGQWLTAHAPRGSFVVGPTGDLPWPYKNVQWYTEYWFAMDAKSSRQALLAHPVRTLSNDLTDSSHKASFLVFTRAQTAMVNSQGMMPAGSTAHIEQTVLGSGRFRVVFHNADATILVPARPGARP